ncbi:MAG: SEC-C domain-containing protein [Solirubrobacteraceae bacterium]
MLLRCGSGLKYKRCHEPIDKAAAQARRHLPGGIVADPVLSQALGQLEHEPL